MTDGSSGVQHSSGRALNDVQLLPLHPPPYLRARTRAERGIHGPWRGLSAVGERRAVTDRFLSSSLVFFVAMVLRAAQALMGAAVTVTMLAMSDELASAACSAAGRRQRQVTCTGWDGSSEATRSGVWSVAASLLGQDRRCARAALSQEIADRQVPWSAVAPEERDAVMPSPQRVLVVDAGASPATPASYAGRTTWVRAANSDSTLDPRVCGEDTGSCAHPELAFPRPPRMRGGPRRSFGSL
ncbi:hypothetical protein SAMN05421595_0121 [Austwickia chelonae]|nr:hypothetical protein SAMN05421595_0121 [Austwickia chelonae]